jgi:hypothetical protein
MKRGAFIKLGLLPLPIGERVGVKGFEAYRTACGRLRLSAHGSARWDGLAL